MICSSWRPRICRQAGREWLAAQHPSPDATVQLLTVDWHMSALPVCLVLTGWCGRVCCHRCFFFSVGSLSEGYSPLSSHTCHTSLRLTPRAGNRQVGGTIACSSTCLHIIGRSQWL